MDIAHCKGGVVGIRFGGDGSGDGMAGATLSVCGTAVTGGGLSVCGIVVIGGGLAVCAAAEVRAGLEEGGAARGFCNRCEQAAVAAQYVFQCHMQHVCAVTVKGVQGMGSSGVVVELF